MGGRMPFKLPEPRSQITHIMLARIVVNDFHQSKSPNLTELDKYHKAQRERQKIQAIQEQICPQRYLLTAYWQDDLFPIPCK